MIDMSKFGPDNDSGLSFLEQLELREGIMPHVEHEEQPEEDTSLSGQTVMAKTAIKRYQMRRASSEMELLDSFIQPVVKPFQKGCVYNFMTRGDVDALSYLKLVLRMQDIFYAIVSTWCVDMNDIKTMKQWVDDGRIKQLDLYLGEIYTTGRHGLEAADFQAVFEGYKNVKVVVARNHSKVMAIDGMSFYCFVQTSANINTNPRVESTSILVPDDTEASELMTFYEEFFKTVKPLTKKVPDSHDNP